MLLRSPHRVPFGSLSHKYTSRRRKTTSCRRLMAPIQFQTALNFITRAPNSQMKITALAYSVTRSQIYKNMNWLLLFQRFCL